jgi:hypothetical protein
MFRQAQPLRHSPAQTEDLPSGEHVHNWRVREWYRYLRTGGAHSQLAAKEGEHATPHSPDESRAEECYNRFGPAQ